MGTEGGGENQMTVFDLKTHETMSIGAWNIMRVPGGWIYSHTNYQKVAHDRNTGEHFMDTHSIFVPYSDIVKKDIFKEIINNDH